MAYFADYINYTIIVIHENITKCFFPHILNTVYEIVPGVEQLKMLVGTII